MAESITVDAVNDLGGMWLIFAEAGVALALGVFIVWWTLPRKPRPPADQGKNHE